MITPEHQILYYITPSRPKSSISPYSTTYPPYIIIHSNNHNKHFSKTTTTNFTNLSSVYNLLTPLILPQTPQQTIDMSTPTKNTFGHLMKRLLELEDVKVVIIKTAGINTIEFLCTFNLCHLDNLKNKKDFLYGKH